MTKSELIERISKGGYTQEKLLGWVNAMAGTTSNRKPSYNKVGDVYLHAVFQHPYILLQKKKEEWICGLLTHDGDFPDNLEKCDSRFFEESYIVKSLFTVTEVKGSYINNYENIKHLREILTKLKTIFK